MNVVLSMMRRDKWTAQKIPFDFVYWGSSQNLPRAPSLSQALGAYKKSGINY